MGDEAEYLEGQHDFTEFDSDGFGDDGHDMFLRCTKLTATQINIIMESLPAWTDGELHRITFTGCAGASTCDPSIGTQKGWTIII